VIEADDFGDVVSARTHFQDYLDAAPDGKHAGEVRNRLSGLAARRTVASNSAASGPEDNRMPRYAPYVPTPGVVAEPVTPPVAIQPDDSDGGWR
jgi:hypothetical protein